MIFHCSYHKNEHEDYEWRSNKYGTFCRESLIEIERPGDEPFSIGGGKKEQRLAHWQDIKSRVKTHEGQFLTGEAGREYQQKFSSKYLGKDLGQKTNFNAPEYQKELAKT